jgi:hypothetical protein
VLLLLTSYLCFMFMSIISDGYIKQNYPVVWHLTVFKCNKYRHVFATVFLVCLMGSGFLMMETF